MKAVYENGGVTISGLSADDVAEMKDELTFDNPAYAQVKKYSRYSYTSVPQFLSYYKKVKNGYQVPLGYFDPNIFEGEIIDTRVCPTLKKVPEFVLELRDTQKEAAKAYLNKNSSDNTKASGCVQLPTGKGKTILALYIASVLKTPTLVVVHKDDLVKGWFNDIDLAFKGKVDTGLIKAKIRKVGKFITVATIQTLNRLSDEELDKLYNHFGFIVQDEMHHCPSSTFGTASRFNARYKLGLTATPERSDGLEHVMQLYFGAFCYTYKPTDDDEDILPVEVRYKTLETAFNPIYKKVGGYYRKVTDNNRPLKKDEVYLTDIPYSIRPKIQHNTEDKIVCERIKEEVCEDIIYEYRAGHSCIVFFTLVESLNDYYDYLIESGVPESDLLLYFGNRKENDENLSVAKSERNKITLTTYAKTTEGTDCRLWEVAFLVSSLNNGKNVEQAVGRVRRISSTPKLKMALVYDYRLPNVYGYSRHFDTRMLRYRKILAKLVNRSGDDRKIFYRGYRKRV